MTRTNEASIGQDKDKKRKINEISITDRESTLARFIMDTENFS